MSSIHTTSFCVRHYECDARGYVHYANYLRYMQEAAFAASAAVGYDEARYAKLGYQWLAYETDIEYTTLLRHGDTFTVKTWVHDFRRVRSLRNYEFNRADMLVARASTDWVFINQKTQRPAAILPEMVVAYAQGNLEAAPRSSPLPSPKEPLEGVFSLSRRVEWRDVDIVQHVNNAVYIHYAEDCGLQARRALGWPLARLHDEGYTIVARRHQIEYKVPARLDDELKISTWISDGEKTSTIQHYLIRRVSDGELLARVNASYEWIDLKTEKPVTTPQAYLNDWATISAEKP